MKMFKILSVAVLAAFVFQSCDKDDDNDDNSGTNATTFKVRMTDAPGNYSAMTVQVTKVEAYVENYGWVDLNTTSQNVAVLDLTNGTEMTLANDLTAQTGHYTQLRLTMGTSNSVTVHDQSGDSDHDLNWSGAANNMVVINIDKQVNAGTTNTVLIDFNVAESVSSDILGNYNLNPSITWIEDEATGVKGDVDGASQGYVTFTSGTNTYTSYIADDGKFMIRGMENGIYDMTLSAMHDGENTLDELEMQDVVVANGQITNMGAITFN